MITFIQSPLERRRLIIAQTPVKDHQLTLIVFVAASHQTRLDTKSKARRPIKVGIRGREGRERVETRTLLVCAAHRLTWCNVSLMRQAVSQTQMWVRARMPGYGLNQTPRSSAIHRFQRASEELGLISKTRKQ